VLFERVFTIAHAYRAEPSMTTRHLTEYIGLDVEMGFIDSWEDVYQTADKLLRFIFAELKEIKPEIDALRGKGREMFIPEIAEKTPVLKLREAQEKILGKSNCQEPDLSPEDEKKICEWAKKKKVPIWLLLLITQLKKGQCIPFLTLKNQNIL